MVTGVVESASIAFVCRGGSAVVWLCGCAISWVVGWLGGWVVGWLSGRLIFRLVGGCFRLQRLERRQAVRSEGNVNLR